jgi:molybdopterin-dependent oxidoreductase alpha subunit
VDAIRAMNGGKVKVFIGMGGNFVSSTPDTSLTEGAIKKCELTAYISTKLNRSHLVTGRQAFILPCLGRTEIDLQNDVPQKVTVEDSMSMVHTSEGVNNPASEYLLSEPAIVSCMAIASLPNTKIDWEGLVSNYDRIRDQIERVLPAFKNFNERLKHPGGFYLGNTARERKWNTSTGKANFITAALPILSTKPGQIRLMTIRSHDQYNTTIYGLDDRYRGIKGERKVIFLNESDMRKKNIVSGDLLNIFSFASDGIRRTANGFKAIPYNIPEGCAAAYFPEANVLVPLNSVADKSHTPTSKFIEIEIERAIGK